MRHARVKSIVEAVAFEVDVLGYAVVERVIAQVVAVQLAGQIRVPDVVDLRDTCEDVAAGRVRLPASRHGCGGGRLEENWIEGNKGSERIESISFRFRVRVGRDELASLEDDVTVFL